VADPYIGEIRIFAGNFAPHGWALCNGQLLAISQNTALFSLLGTYYGGDGKTTFALPNFQGSVPMHQGQGPGLTLRDLGEVGGSPTVTLLTTEMPSHAHTFTGQQAQADSTSPSNTFVAVNRNLSPYTAPNAPGLNLQPMNPLALVPAGSSQPHNNLQPFLGLTFIICMQGIFPSRN
jgi:microcystin-dependent protein